ncbi:hypothetical protein ZWY2020_018867 [Hordeum vulgare]|nr:hypothetical protein ZWY2020_018867 [Hordeum vulgare]
MGSLMAGWSSHALDDDHKVRFMRNRSLTKEEVEAFWRQHRKPAAEDTVRSTSRETVVASSPRPGSPRPTSRTSTLSYVRSSPPVMTTNSVDGDGEAAASPSASRDWDEEQPCSTNRLGCSEGGGVGQGAAATV